MAIAAAFVGTWTAANATTQTVTLPTHVAGSMLLVRVAFKHATISSEPTCGTSGWTRLGTYANGTTASGNGTGSVRVAVFYKIATSSAETNPVITYHASTAATPSMAVAVVYSKGVNDTWETPVGAGGPDTTAGTSHSATITSHVSATAGDVIDFFSAQCDDTTQTVPTFTQAGLTLGTVVEYPASAGSSTTSNDIACDGGYRAVSSGTSSAAAVVTGTLSTSETGTSWTTRLRVTSVDNRDASVVNTGGGVVAVARVKGGQGDGDATGGGVFTPSTTGAHSKIVTATGGGVLVPVGRKGAQSDGDATGGGIATIDAVAAEGGGAKEYSAVLTGGGVAAISAAKGGLRAVAATGGGVLVPVGRKGAQSDGDATGGGIAVLSDRKGGQTSAVLTGGGVAAIAIAHGGTVQINATGAGVLAIHAEHGAFGRVSATGGGIATVDGVKAGGSDNRDYSAAITGGGVVTLGILSGRQSSPTLTGGGAAALGTSGAHTASIAITGGGVFTLTYEAEGAEARAEVEVVLVDMMQQGAGPVAKRRGQTPFDDWTLAMDDESVLELYVLGKTR